MKAGESPEEAAVREVKEELGIDIKVEKHLRSLKRGCKLCKNRVREKTFFNSTSDRTN